VADTTRAGQTPRGAFFDVDFVMTVGPLSIVSSIAGVPRVQAKGSDVERERLDAGTAARQSESARKADDAAGVGTTSEESATDERDADGRRLWERRAAKEKPVDGAPSESEPRAKDPSGAAGSQLDLSG
jgi:hypothetical protein